MTANQSCKTLGPIMMHHHTKFVCHETKFSSKRISSSDDILESHILIIWCFTLTLKTANQSFKRTIWLWWCTTIPTLAVKDSAIQKILSGQTFIDIISFAVTLTMNTVSWYCEPNQPQKNISGLNTNFSLSPSYSAHKLSNHKFTKIYNTSPDTNLYKTIHTYTNIKHKFFEELVPSVLPLLKKST